MHGKGPIKKQTTGPWVCSKRPMAYLGTPSAIQDA